MVTRSNAATIKFLLPETINTLLLVLLLLLLLLVVVVVVVVVVLGYADAQLVEAVLYKPEGRGFDSQ